MAGKVCKKSSKPKASYSEMVLSAITIFNNPTGSTRQAIVSYIVFEYRLDEKVAAKYIKSALKWCVKKGILEQVSGAGVLRYYKILKSKSVDKKLKKKNNKKSWTTFYRIKC